MTYPSCLLWALEKHYNFVMKNSRTSESGRPFGWKDFKKEDFDFCFATWKTCFPGSKARKIHLIAFQNFSKNILLTTEILLDTLVVLFRRLQGQKNEKENVYLPQKVQVHLVGKGLKIVARAWGYHRYCCSNPLRQNFLWASQADEIECVAHISLNFASL